MKNEFNEDKLARKSIALTGRIISEYGPRIAGGESCRKAAEALHHDLALCCDRAHLETFGMHPGSFLGFMYTSSTLFIAASFLLLFDYMLGAAIGYTLAQVMAFTQFICYWQVFDPLYPKREGRNVHGVIEPTHDVRCQVMLSGHHDSAYEFLLMKWLRGVYRIVVAGMIASLAVAPIITWTMVVYRAMTGTAPGFAAAVTYGTFVCFLFIIPMYFFMGRRGTPGAGDNLIASAMVVELAKHFREAKKSGRGAPRHTRLIFASFDAEEAGLRGSRAFAKRHGEELRALPTRVLNMDSIYRKDRIKFLVSDINGFVKLSRAMAQECVEIAETAGCEAKLFHVYPGVGGTDAAEFAKTGVEATTLIAVPTDVEKERMVYHTQDDTIENIEPGAVEACLRIMYEYIMKKDREAGAV
ncbi:MAG: M28 family metallopeptidase [Spirochaetes bacterium]|nr:M28 family metallopeptidase [Spirochaetota bacterium]